MKARLVYSNDKESFTLREDDLEKLDDYIYNVFSSQDDIFKKYCGDMENLSVIGGEFSIEFNTGDIPVEHVDDCARLGMNLKRRTQNLSMLTGEREISPSKTSLLTESVGRILNSGDTKNYIATSFFDDFSPKDKFYYLLGEANNCDEEFTYDGIKKVLASIVSGSDGYFMSRVLLESIVNFRINNNVCKDEEHSNLKK